MDKNEVYTWLCNHCACIEALNWFADHDSVQEAYEFCDKRSWLFWLYYELYLVDVFDAKRRELSTEFLSTPDGVKLVEFYHIYREQIRLLCIAAKSKVWYQYAQEMIDRDQRDVFLDSLRDGEKILSFGTYESRALVAEQKLYVRKNEKLNWEIVRRALKEQINNE
jgi:hypothetical protein